MLNQYWPKEEQVELVMHTEAEVSAEHLLLAVHEPMRLSHRYKGDSSGDLRTENELLNDLLTLPYPIPIVGAPGTGKSHLVCWLDAKLRVNKSCADWHIIRIPKAASLRQVLELLLDGLSDTSLKATREKIQKIGKGLKIDQVANSLILDITFALAELYEKVGADLKTQKDSDPASITRDQISRHAMLKRHAGYEGLGALIGDSTFKQRLVGKDKCLYRIARRFTEGKKRKEEDEEKLALITLDDLGINDLDTRKLSEAAGHYIKRVQLTGQEKQSEVVNLLNELLEDALHRTATNLYQVEGFTDLFTEIRRYLKQKNQTLVLLIEDLSAISAIKDELLDNLLVNSLYKGQEDLCPIRSVFAVTTDAEGYKAYTGRRDTILSRLGNKEWHIDDSLPDEQDTMARIENLCGRYLNAARIGFDLLKQTYNERKSEESEWPLIWKAGADDDVEVVKAFGESLNGHPLFPFNKHALKALAYAYCYQTGKLQYVPRDIINLILKSVLTSYRTQFTDNKFPSTELLEALPNANGYGSADISTEVAHSLQSKMELTGRIKTLVTIWGYKADDLPDLAQAMPHQIPRLFCEDQLADILINVISGVPFTPTVTPIVPSTVVPTVDPTGQVVLKGKVSRLKEISRDVDSWFSTGAVPPDDAKTIRKALQKELEFVLSEDYGKWVAVKNLKEEIKGLRPPISVGFSGTNPTKCILCFGKPATTKHVNGHYGDDSSKYKSFIIALKRYEENQRSWKYSLGFTDYCRYQSFINEWVVESIQILVEQSRESVKGRIKEHLKNAYIFNPELSGFYDKLRFVCHPFESQADKGFFPPDGISSFLANTPVKQWNEKVSSIAYGWDDSTKLLLSMYTPGLPYAIEGDLLKSIFHGAIDPMLPFSKDVSREAKIAQDALKYDYKIFELLQGCSTEEEFQDTLNDLSGLLRGLSDEGVYSSGTGMTALQVSNKVAKVLKEDSWPTTKALLRLLGSFEASEIVTNLGKVDEEKANNVRAILLQWKQNYTDASQRLRTANVASGHSDTAAEKRQVQNHLINIKSKLTELEGLSHD